MIGDTCVFMCIVCVWYCVACMYANYIHCEIILNMRPIALLIFVYSVIFNVYVCVCVCVCVCVYVCVRARVFMFVHCICIA